MTPSADEHLSKLTNMMRIAQLACARTRGGMTPGGWADDGGGRCAAMEAARGGFLCLSEGSVVVP
jgi:hypothetical protein